ncbi:MAG TPA: hypothetical protein VFP43_19320 [Mesorhizobium sp.]|nr:hypothetical protein [Mesorhizobium sp.]
MHNSARFAAVLATAAIAYVPAPAAAQSCEDLILGAALSATGIYAANGNNTKNGYEFAVKKSTTPAASRLATSATISKSNTMMTNRRPRAPRSWSSG